MHLKRLPTKQGSQRKVATINEVIPNKGFMVFFHYFTGTTQLQHATLVQYIAQVWPL
jgi:hypothetical protein